MAPIPSKLPRFVVSITGPGDPIWHGGPSKERIARIRRVCWTPTPDTYNERDGSVRKIQGRHTYQRINHLIDPQG